MIDAFTLWLCGSAFAGKSTRFSSVVFLKISGERVINLIHASTHAIIS